MKKTFLFLSSIFLVSVAFSQQNEIEFRNSFFGMQFYQDGKKISMPEVARIIQPNEAAFKYISSAKTNNTVAGIFGAIGGALIGFPLGTAVSGGDPNWTLAAVGSGFIVASIPFSVTATKKARTAVALYNEGTPSTNSRKQPEMHFQFSGNAARMVVRL
jgi:hypothetical protein